MPATATPTTTPCSAVPNCEHTLPARKSNFSPYNSFAWEPFNEHAKSRDDGGRLTGVSFRRYGSRRLHPNAITGATATGTHTADAGSSSLLADYDDGDGHIYDIRTNPALAAVSGYGLTVTDGNGTHSSKWEEDWQSNITQTNPTTPDGTLVASQQFYVDLGASYDNLDELYVWNVREQTARGTKDVDLYYSDLADPGADLSVTANWTLLDSYVFSQSTGGGTGVDNVIDLSSVSSARHFGFDISSITATRAAWAWPKCNLRSCPSRRRYRCC